MSEADENALLNPISDNNIDFQGFTEVEKTKGITLAQLKESADIVDIKGDLSNEINAYQLINQVTSICNEFGLTYEIKDLFVADNKNKALGNGISINKQLCEAYQTENQTTNIPFKAVTFNRVFANINLTDLSNSTHIANIVVASNQKGLTGGYRCELLRLPQPNNIRSKEYGKHVRNNRQNKEYKRLYKTSSGND